MAKPLTHEQYNALRHEAGRMVPAGERMNHRGLVQRGLLAYRWGRDPSHGYVMTGEGKRTLAMLIKLNKEGPTR